MVELQTSPDCDTSWLAAENACWWQTQAWDADKGADWAWSQQQGESWPQQQQQSWPQQGVWQSDDAILGSADIATSLTPRAERVVKDCSQALALATRQKDPEKCFKFTRKQLCKHGLVSIDSLCGVEDSMWKNTTLPMVLLKQIREALNTAGPVDAPVDLAHVAIVDETATQQCQLGRVAEFPGCCLCFNFTTHPVVTLCGHLFCHFCLTKYWEQIGMEACTCPVCYTPVSEEWGVIVLDDPRRTGDEQSTLCLPQYTPSIEEETNSQNYLHSEAGQSEWPSIQEQSCPQNLLHSEEGHVEWPSDHDRVCPQHLSHLTEVTEGACNGDWGIFGAEDTPSSSKGLSPELKEKLAARRARESGVFESQAMESSADAAYSRTR